MTSDQYSELIGFLGGKFEAIDQRFETVDQRFEEAKLERAAIRDEARRHANVLFEQSQANLKAVAEGLGLRIDRLEAALPYSGGA